MGHKGGKVVARVAEIVTARATAYRVQGADWFDRCINFSNHNNEPCEHG
jgi:hypothetical protein